MLGIFAVLAFLTPTLGYAGQTYIGVGADSCGAWVQSRKKMEGAAGYQYRAWVYGYLSGLNVPLAVDILEKPDGPAILVWMDNYCKANPLDKIVKAASQLSIELGSRARPK